MSDIESNMQKNIEHNFKKIMQAIEKHQLKNSISNTPVRLLAVTKTHTSSSIESAYAIGLRDFGENYVNEAVEKITFLNDKKNTPEAIWHFIGPLQSNKTRLIAKHFNWVHSVERLKIAQRLSEQRPSNFPPLHLCLQVNINNEDSKSGCAPSDALALALEIIHLPRVQLRGLMCIPAPLDTSAEPSTQRAPFHELAQLFNSIKAQLPSTHAQSFDTLSMGMSDDFELAIAEGSTLVRLGSALFGQRKF